MSTLPQLFLLEFHLLLLPLGLLVLPVLKLLLKLVLLPTFLMFLNLLTLLMHLRLLPLLLLGSLSPLRQVCFLTFPVWLMGLHPPPLLLHPRLHQRLR
jgi:hypothetical protein